jgi:hypothetical protein
MEPTHRPLDARAAARLATGLAALVLLAGLAGLLVYSSAEAMANPGYSLADGYGLGRLPWMAIIELLVVGGAASCLLVGATTTLAFGGRLQRVLLLPPVVLAGMWWFLALARAGVGGGACPQCPPPAFDPLTYAYSAPLLAFQLLILPALAVALLGLTVPPRPSAEGSYISPS